MTQEPHLISGAATDETIGSREGACDPRTTIAPRKRPAAAVPHVTLHEEVTVAQGSTGQAYRIARVAADQAVGLRDNPAHSRARISPSGRSARAVPERAFDHVVTVPQRREVRVTGRYLIPRIAADEAIHGRDRSTNSGAAVGPGCRTAL